MKLVKQILIISFVWERHQPEIPCTFKHVLNKKSRKDLKPCNNLSFKLDNTWNSKLCQIRCNDICIENLTKNFPFSFISTYESFFWKKFEWNRKTVAWRFMKEKKNRSYLVFWSNRKLKSFCFSELVQLYQKDQHIFFIKEKVTHFNTDLPF